MADKSIKAINIKNGNTINVLTNALGMYVDTETGEQYSVDQIKILTDEQIEYIERRKKRYEEVMNCTDWDAFTVEVAKIVLSSMMEKTGTDFLDSTIEKAAEATKTFVDNLQYQMMEPNKILRL